MTSPELLHLAHVSRQVNTWHRSVGEALRDVPPPAPLCHRLRAFRQRRLLDLLGSAVQARRMALSAGRGNATPQAAWQPLCRLFAAAGSAARCRAPQRRGPAGLSQRLQRAATALPIWLQARSGDHCGRVARGLGSSLGQEAPSAPAQAPPAEEQGANGSLIELFAFLDDSRLLPRQAAGDLPVSEPLVSKEQILAHNVFAECSVTGNVPSGAKLGSEGRDVTGQWVEFVGLAELLAEIGRVVPLSRRLVNILYWQLLDEGVHSKPCEGVGRAYSPLLCLVNSNTWAEQGKRWREMNIFLGHRKEKDMVMQWQDVEWTAGNRVGAVDDSTAIRGDESKAEKPMASAANGISGSGGGADGPDWDLEGLADNAGRRRVPSPSRPLPDGYFCKQNEAVNGVALLVQTSEYSPDAFFLHPYTLTCAALPHVDLRITMPKVLYIPINPLIPPPVEVVTEAVVPSTAIGDASPGMPWLVHCSLAGVVSVLEKHVPNKYVLVHVEHTFAVFALEAILRQTRLASSASRSSLEPRLTSSWDAWYYGWFCSPTARHFAGLEALLGLQALELGDRAASEDARSDMVARYVVPLVSRHVFVKSGPSLPPTTPQKSDGAAAGEEWLPWPAGAAWYSGSSWAWQADPDSAGEAVDVGRLYLRPDGRIEHVGGSAQGAWSIRSGGLSATFGDAQYSFLRSSAQELKLEFPLPALRHRSALLLEGNRNVSGDWQGQEAHRNHLAARPLEEFPGLRWLIRDRGRCVEGECECYPPFRGGACDLVDEGLPRRRVDGAVVWYLAHSSEDDVADLRTSLQLLWRHFNERRDYPVVLFHEGVPRKVRQSIIEDSENRIWFARMTKEEFWGSSAGPSAAGPDEPLGLATWESARRLSGGWNHHSRGYRAVSRWQAGAAFQHPVLRRAPYAMYLDTDAYFPGFTAEDPIALLAESGGVFGFSRAFGQIPTARENHLWEATLLYIHLRHRDPRGSNLLRSLADEDLNFRGGTGFVDYHVAATHFFRDRAGYGDYFEYLDSMGGWWHHSWYSTLAVTLGVAIWAADHQVLPLDTPYAHQVACVCGAPGDPQKPRCVQHADGALAMSYWMPSRRAARGLWLCWEEEQLQAFREAGGKCIRDESHDQFYYCTGTPPAPAMPNRALWQR